MATTHRKLDTGIYADRYGIAAVVSVAAGRKGKRFPRNTDLAIIRRWRNETKTKLQFLWLHEKAVQDDLAKIPNLPGWCYLYVIGGIGCIKIGRSRDPQQRLRELQTGHDTELRLLAAVPCHESLEPTLHERFKYLKRQGEWFVLEGEMARFVADLQDGRNPALWIWPAIGS